jgi:cholesterol transport system auxiliary component
MKPALLAGLALLLAGCMPHGPQEPERFFVLYPAPTAAGARYTGPPVLVAPTGAASFYGTVQIVYSDSPGTRSRYRYSFWTEPPQAVLHDQLASRLQDGDGVPRLLLETRMLELFHDAGTAPGEARITVVARLASLPGHTAIAERSFSRTVRAPSFNAAGAVAAMRTALAAVLDDIVAWVAGQPTPGAPPTTGAPADATKSAASRVPQAQH